MSEFFYLFLFIVTLFLFCRWIFNQETEVNIEKKEYAETEDNSNREEMYKKINKFLSELKEAKKEYFTNSKKTYFIKKYKELFETLKDEKSLESENIKKFNYIYLNLSGFVEKWNDEYVALEMERNEQLFDSIDGKLLDEQQRRAVVVDEDSNLIVAGAGSGKTLSIVAKVKYLVEVKGVDPEKILLISFTRKAVDEMQERILELGININPKTFHKLGLDIIEKKREYRPDIEDKFDKIIDDYFKENIYKNYKQIRLLLVFFSYYLNIPKDLNKFSSLGESYDHFRGADFETVKGKIEREAHNLKEEKKTIRGETVRSIEELVIANFLFLNGITYIYEHKYPHDTNDRYRKTYKPDFYLPDYNIYIEHFGVNGDFRAPWLSEIEEKKYLDGIEWKRKIHKKNNTTLVETYSYYNEKGALREKLKKKLTSLDVEFNEASQEELRQAVCAIEESNSFSEFKKLIRSFIDLYKSSGFTEDSFNTLKENIKEDSVFLENRTFYFLSIVKPIYIKYQNDLRKNNAIDFNDMIGEAVDIVESGEVDLNYEYIIIDEYQDTSISRFKLAKAIEEKTKAKIICVGDDWQSIYRFAGSDIDLFTNFEKYFGFHELLTIEKTYRNSQELIDIAQKFVMSNPNQIKKSLSSIKHYTNPIRIINYERNNISSAIGDAIEEIVYLFGKNAEITILGRNNFDINKLQDEQDEKKEKDHRFKIKKMRDSIIIVDRENPKAKIIFLTVHRSKGMEFENVIIINLENYLVGFPNKISDDPVLSLVLSRPEEHCFAEERRLFYVALTRTKNITYLITPEYNMSSFCEELLENFNIYQCKEMENKPGPKKMSCHVCKKGYLVVKESKENNNKFLGCTNYPSCRATLRVEVMDNSIICPSCGGYMIEREKNGNKFYGCTNYPLCTNCINNTQR